VVNTPAHIREILCSNYIPEIGYSHRGFLWIFSVPPGKFFKIRPQLLPFTSFPIYHSFIYPGVLGHVIVWSWRNWSCYQFYLSLFLDLGELGENKIHEHLTWTWILNATVARRNCITLQASSDWQDHWDNDGMRVHCWHLEQACVTQMAMNMLRAGCYCKWILFRMLLKVIFWYESYVKHGSARNIWKHFDINFQGSQFQAQ
jgi:hypothetical protein